MPDKRRRAARPDITALLLWRSETIVTRDPEQVFYETAATYELWQNTPLLRRLKLWRKTSVGFVWNEA